MTKRCKDCGSMNADALKSCGKCGGPLELVEIVITQKPGRPWDETRLKCPFCSHPLENGSLEVPGHSTWTGELGSATITSDVLEGYRCRGCGCLLVYY